jgi:putative flippase GtrA
VTSANHPEPQHAIVSEAKTAARALVASGAATIADAAFYNLMLTLLSGRYTWSAIAGAVAGAITNFTLSRTWVFAGSSKRIDRQALEYALGSFLTYVVLQGSLWLLIEKAEINARLAWIPAKVIAWCLVSYPFSRLIVFSKARGPR